MDVSLLQEKSTFPVLSAFSASNQIPIGHVLTELLKIFLPEVGGFFQMWVIVVVVVSRDSPPWYCSLKPVDLLPKSYGF